MEQKYVVDYIGEDYKGWSNELVLISAGTGRGKTTFIADVLLTYAVSNNKRLLYLCNRSELQTQVTERIPAELKPFIKITTYQAFEKQLQAMRRFDHYDYIVGDEAHYFFDDSFNRQTDISGKYLVNTAIKDSVVILMSATGNLIFPTLIRAGYVKHKDHYYEIPGNYDFVDKVFMYQKKYVDNIISKILNETDDKILFFCNDLNCLGKMYKVYGEQAYYRCSKSRRKSSVIPSNILKIGDDCIRKVGDCIITFDKRILFTTTVLDNGVDIKDPSLKHIFSEVFDFNALIQSLGRKRSLSTDDHCSFYIMYHEGTEIEALKRRLDKQLNVIDSYNSDYSRFQYLMGKDRSFMEQNPAFFLGKRFQHNGIETEIHLNTMYSYKLNATATLCNEMLTEGYHICLEKVIENTMQKKVELYHVYRDLKQEFLTLLGSLVGQRLFTNSKEYQDLRQLFSEMKINRSNSASLNKINLFLQSEHIPYLLESKKCKDRGEYRDKTYWIIQTVANSDT